MTLCLKHTVPEIYEGSNFLDQLITFNGLNVPVEQERYYCQRSSESVCREKVMDAELSAFSGSALNRQMRKEELSVDIKLQLKDQQDSVENLWKTEVP